MRHFILSALGALLLLLPVRGSAAPSSPPTLLFALAQHEEPQDSLRAGNIATPVRQGLWQWTAFLTAPERTLREIRCVEYRLHESFPDPVREVCARGKGPHAFALTTTSWGTFTLHIRVYFKDGQTQDLEHPLQF